MVRLVSMTEADYQQFLEVAVADYARENVKAGYWHIDEAMQKSQEVYNKFLPDGLSTKNHYLCRIEDENIPARVGFLWFAVQERGLMRVAFVYEVTIDEQFRRRGYGSQAFRMLEEKVRALELDTISLHVFGHNHAARKMYEKLGYETTSVMMAKKLEPQEE